MALNNLFPHRGDRRWLRPSWRLANRHTGVSVARVGLLFLVLQIAIAVAYESDTLVLALIRGTAEVAVFSVSFKLFMVVPLLRRVSSSLRLWPAYAEAQERGDTAWLRRTLRRTLALSAAIRVPVAVFLLFFGAPLVHLWAGGDLTPPLHSAPRSACGSFSLASARRSRCT